MSTVDEKLRHLVCTARVGSFAEDMVCFGPKDSRAQRNGSSFPTVRSGAILRRSSLCGDRRPRWRRQPPFAQTLAGSGRISVRDTRGWSFRRKSARSPKIVRMNRCWRLGDVQRSIQRQIQAVQNEGELEERKIRSRVQRDRQVEWFSGDARNQRGRHVVLENARCSFQILRCD